MVMRLNVFPMLFCVHRIGLFTQRKSITIVAKRAEPQKIASSLVAAGEKRAKGI